METSSEELGEVLGEKGKELDQWKERRHQKVKAEGLKGIYMAKIIFGIDRYHCKKLSALCPGPSSGGVNFFATLVISIHSLNSEGAL